jgi:heme/copper-type cytochrome/quinol oxidase subunit 1
MKISAKPHHLLGITGVLLILLSFFPNDRTIDIHVHDTVFIIAAPHIYGGLGILLLFFWFIYQIVYKILFSKILVWIHIISTILFFIFLVIISYAESSSMPRQYNYALYFLNRIAVGLSIVAVFAQLIFLFNILAGLGKNKKR